MPSSVFLRSDSTLIDCYLNTHIARGARATVFSNSAPTAVTQTSDGYILCYVKGLRRSLRAKRDIELIAEATNGQEAIELFQLHRPDVTLMDLQMPVMNGIDAISAIRSDSPNARFIVLVTYQGDVQALRALKAGASGYLLKNVLRKELLDTIRVVHAGKKRIPPEIAIELADHVTDDALSDRKIEVLRRVATGNSNKIIAEQLTVSEATVKEHMKSIFSKLGANDRTHAVTIAMKRGFLDG
jgi:DNA-binding NarL/FixJ family response regulator